jgi:hypothetical protein
MYSASGHLSGHKRSETERHKNYFFLISMGMVREQRSIDGLVGVVTTPSYRRSIPDKGRHFLFSVTSGSVLGLIQSPIQWEPGIKRQGREAGHSHLCSAEVKNGGAMLLHLVIN